MMKTSDQTNEIFAALASAQAEMSFAKADKLNSHLKAEYASLSALQEAYRGPCGKYKLAVIQNLYSEGDDYFVETRLAHASGQWLSSILKVLLQKRDMQGLGSAATYAKRYTISSLLGISTEVDDEAVAQVEQKAQVARQAMSSAVDTSKQMRAAIEASRNPATGHIRPSELARNAPSMEPQAPKVVPNYAPGADEPSKPRVGLVDYENLAEPAVDWPGWDYKIEFGKYLNKTIREVGFKPVKDYVKWLDDESFAKNKALPPPAKNLRERFVSLSLKA